MSDDVLDDMKARIIRLEACYDAVSKSLSDISIQIGAIKENYNMTKLLIQWVIFPLVAILGGIVGVKIVFPSI